MVHVVWPTSWTTDLLLGVPTGLTIFLVGPGGQRKQDLNKNKRRSEEKQKEI